MVHAHRSVEGGVQREREREWEHVYISPGIWSLRSIFSQVHVTLNLTLTPVVAVEVVVAVVVAALVVVRNVGACLHSPRSI